MQSESWADSKTKLKNLHSFSKAHTAGPRTPRTRHLLYIPKKGNFGLGLGNFLHGPLELLSVDAMARMCARSQDRATALRVQVKPQAKSVVPRSREVLCCSCFFPRDHKEGYFVQGGGRY